MKAITFKTLAFLALAANVVLFSCKKKDDTPTPTTNNSTNADTAIIYKKDTMWSAAGDSGSRTFLNGPDGLVYTANQVSQNKIAATILMGYNYNTSSTSYAASITDISAYADSYSWSGSTTVTNFKTVSLDSISFSNLGYTSVANLYKNSSVAPSATVYNIQPGQVIAFAGASGQYGALRVIKIVTNDPGGVVNPYSTYIVYSLLLQE